MQGGGAILLQPKPDGLPALLNFIISKSRSCWLTGWEVEALLLECRCRNTLEVSNEPPLKPSGVRGNAYSKPARRSRLGGSALKPTAIPVTLCCLAGAMLCSYINKKACNTY